MKYDPRPAPVGTVLGKEPDTASAASQNAAGSRGFTALRVHNFRLYLAGSAFSRVGDNMESVARAWLVWQLTQSPFWLGVMVFCHWIPTTTLSIFAGTLADRVDNRKLIMYSESLYLISALGTGALTLLGIVNVWEIGVLVLIHGLSNAISGPSRQVFIHDTVGRDKLMSAVSLTDSLFQCMQFIGPAIAGVLIATLGVGATYTIDALMFVPAIVIMAIIRVPKHERQPASLSPLQSSIEGLKYVRRTPLLLSMLLLATFPALLVGDSITTFMPIFATQILKVGPEGMGFLLSAQGAGAITAAVFISYIGAMRHKGKLVIVTCLMFATLLIAFSMSSWYLVSMVILLGTGSSYVISQTIINVSLQLSAADALRGRVMGLYVLGTLGVRSFNGPLIGGVASFFGAPLAMAMLGTTVVAAVIAVAFAFPERNNLD